MCIQKNTLETLVGFVVIVISFWFVYFVYNSTNKSRIGTSDYNVQATFQNIEGIAAGSDVMISGIKIGAVESINLDSQLFVANLVLRINGDIKIPIDSTAAIATSGLLGAKYINISVGAEDKAIEHNGKIKYTQSSINIESLISKFIYSIGSGNNGSSSKNDDATK